MNLDTYEDGGVRVTIWQDDGCPSPREYDQLGMMLMWDRNYNSPDDNPFDSPDDFEAWWHGVGDFADSGEVAPCDDDRYLRLPVYKFEHSGVAYSTADFGDRWDSGQVGWIFTTPDKIEATGAPKDSWAEQLTNEVEQYSQWASGACYGFTVETVSFCDHCGHENIDLVDSCGGFLGHIPLTEIPVDDRLAEALRASFFVE